MKPKTTPSVRTSSPKLEYDEEFRYSSYATLHEGSPTGLLLFGLVVTAHHPFEVGRYQLAAGAPGAEAVYAFQDFGIMDNELLHFTTLIEIPPNQRVSVRQSSDGCDVTFALVYAEK